MMHFYIKSKMVLVILTTIAFFVGDVRASTARILIVVSDNMVNNACSTCYAPWDFYHENYITIIDEWNDVYQNSGMDYRVELAGVVWDKNYDDQVAGNVSLSNISNPSHPILGKYHAMLAAYSADYLVLHSHQYPSSGAAGWAAVSVPSIGSPAIFWTNNINAYVWVHEAGHKHALNHCDGYRRTYDASGNFALTGAIWGFHTVMQYSGGAGCSNSNYVGDFGIATQFASAFADPNRTFNGLYPLGDATGHAHTVPNHITSDATIRQLFNTPANVDLDSSMSIGKIEYANFLALNQVWLKPGFKVKDGLLRVSVGSLAMAKRGLTADSHIWKNDKRSSPSFVQKFEIVSTPSKSSLKIVYEGKSSGHPELFIYDAMGVLRRKIKTASFERTERGFNAVLELNELAPGEYFLRLGVGKHKLYRKFGL